MLLQRVTLTSLIFHNFQLYRGGLEREAWACGDHCTDSQRFIAGSVQKSSRRHVNIIIFYTGAVAITACSSGNCEQVLASCVNTADKNTNFPQITLYTTFIAFSWEVSRFCHFMLTDFETYPSQHIFIGSLSLDHISDITQIPKQLSRGYLQSVRQDLDSHGTAKKPDYSVHTGHLCLCKQQADYPTAGCLVTSFQPGTCHCEWGKKKKKRLFIICITITGLWNSVQLN